MNQVTSPTAPLAPAASERPGSESEPTTPPLTTDIAASELLEQLGYEYFSIAPPPAPDPSDRKLDAKPVRLEPKELSNAAPAQSPARDFWEDVAALSERSRDWPPSGPGLRSDPVAHAIATVSANYALGTDRRPLPPTAFVNSPQLQPGAKEPARSLQESTSSGRATPTMLDFCDVLSSLLGFEQLAGLDEVRDLATGVFTQYRELAASALLAADTNRASALKAAQGRKG